MTLDADLALLPTLTVAQLRSRYADLFGEATPAHNTTWLLRRLAWRLQANTLGDLSQRARQRAAQLANDADLRLTAPQQRGPEPVTPALVATMPVGLAALPTDPRLPPPGTIITRQYKGQQLEVTVLPTGFAYQEKVFLSLSALAKTITGAHCNGFHFFRLTKTEATP
jgi:hypothetical protein